MSSTKVTLHLHLQLIFNSEAQKLFPRELHEWYCYCYCYCYCCCYSYKIRL